MFKIKSSLNYVTFFISFLLVFSGCTPRLIVNNNDPGLKVVKEKTAHRIFGVTESASPFLAVMRKINIPVNKSFGMSAKIMLRAGVVPISNICLGVITDDQKAFSFGPRGNSRYWAAHDPGVFIDFKNEKPFFGDEANNFHEVVVKYDGTGKNFKSYVDGILFGDFGATEFLKNSKFFNLFILNYNCKSQKGLKVDVVYDKANLQK